MARRVGILALQGDFEAHARAVREAGAEAIIVRRPEELEGLDGLIIPGGESTTMLKLLHEEQLFEPVRKFGERKPVFGTCAGAILLASRVLRPEQESLGLMPMEVERNAYGRQLDSRVVHLKQDDGNDLEAVFIRAPIIRSIAPGARVLARYGNDPVLVEHGKHMAATFHPELTEDRSVHRRFIESLG